MRRTRRNNNMLNEGVYDFYDVYDQSNTNTINKIINYYIDKIKKYGKDSLTAREQQIFKDANEGKLTLDNPIYKRNKLTGDIETEKGEAVRLDKVSLIPGVPFLTAKGRGVKKNVVVNGRCYWDVDEDCKYYYVFIVAKISEENPTGLVIYKTVSKSGDKALGAFIVPKADIKNDKPDDLWKKINDKYDKGIILDKEMYGKFVMFEKLFRASRLANAQELAVLYEELKKYPKK
jgi:hypothetical protein